MLTAIVLVLAALVVWLLLAWPTWLLVWVGVMSTVAMVFFAHDKLAALRGRRRVPERLLLTLALFGGSLGIAVGEVLFHHKSAKESFNAWLLLVFLLQLAAILIAR